ncbi:response regulator [Neisseriaceae bacterium TC5R-5]|nr:response regulator [Neisseriaceae bacterium TC5R-5]
MPTPNSESNTYQSVVSAKTPARRQNNYQDPFRQRLFLIIDSLPEMQRAMAMTLSSFGADKVEFASKASDALSKMAKFNFDVVLCDYDLGNGYDGLYLYEEVKERHLIKQSCVFMIVTGERRSQRVISAAELMPDDYLLKPFTGEILRGRLEKAMRRREAFRAVDNAIMRDEYLAAIEICDRKIAEQNEFILDFMKLKGSLALKISDFDNARNLYMAVLRIKPLPWAKMGLAKALASLKAVDEARLLFEEVLTDNERVMEAYDWLAKLHRRNHDLDQAQATLKQATELSPVVFRRQQQLAEVALLNNQLDVAEAASQTTLDIAKYTWHRSPTHYATLARIQLARGDTATVGRTLANLRRDYRYNQQGEWMAKIVDSQLQHKNGHQDKARQLLKDAEIEYRQLAPGLSPEAQMEFARACYAQRQTDSGNAVMSDLVRNHHDDEELLASCGEMFSEIGLSDLGEKLITENVKSVFELNNQAVREAQAGQFDLAIERFIKAHGEMPQNMQVMLNLINATMAYVHRQGWHESHMRRAHDMLGKARELAPTNSKLQKILPAWRALVEKMDKAQWVR